MLQVGTLLKTDCAVGSGWTGWAQARGWWVEFVPLARFNVIQYHHNIDRHSVSQSKGEWNTDNTLQKIKPWNNLAGQVISEELNGHTLFWVGRLLQP